MSAALQLVLFEVAGEPFALPLEVVREIAAAGEMEMLRGGAGTDRGTDAGRERGTDAGRDRGTDAGAERGTDAGRDRDTDADTEPSTDATSESGTDTGRNAGPGGAIGAIRTPGRRVPVFAMRARLGVEGEEPGAAGHVVVARLADAARVGLLVDRVHEVITVAPDAILPPPPLLTGRDAVRALVRLADERLVVLLAVDALVSATELSEALRAVEE